MGRKNLYLHPVPLEEAKTRYFSALADLRHPSYAETVAVEDALERVTAEAVYAKYSSPLYHSAAMDGVAVRAKDTVGAEEDSPLTLTPDLFDEVDTGDPLPSGRDAVIMAEDLVQDGPNYRIMQAAHAWQHIRPMGEDIVEGEMVVTANRVLRPMDLGVLKASGHQEVKVFIKPQVAILPTGTEIIRVGDSDPVRGDIFDSNSACWPVWSGNGAGMLKSFRPRPTITTP